jgi:ribokinase
MMFQFQFFLTSFLSTTSTLAFSLSMKSNSVVVVGSANQDLTSYTPTIPTMGETVMGSTFETSCGGKGANQACAAASLGINPVTMISRVGDDVFGKALLENFKDKGVLFDEQATVLRGEVDGKPISSGVASITVDTKSGDNMIIVTPGANHAMKAEDVEKSLKDLPERPAVVVVQLEILPEAALSALKTGKELGAVTILNPAPAPEGSALKDFYQYCDIVIPNESELFRICGVSDEAAAKDSDIEEKLARDLLNKGVGLAVVVTLGARGAMVVSKDEKGFKTTFVCAPDDLPCKNDPIEDTIGAGDGFCGALSAYLSAGIELERAATLSCGFAGMSVRRRGASYPSGDEIPACLKINNVVAASS